MYLYLDPPISNYCLLVLIFVSLTNNQGLPKRKNGRPPGQRGTPGELAKNPLRRELAEPRTPHELADGVGKEPIARIHEGRCRDPHPTLLALARLTAVRLEEGHATHGDLCCHDLNGKKHLLPHVFQWVGLVPVHQQVDSLYILVPLRGS